MHSLLFLFFLFFVSPFPTICFFFSLIHPKFPSTYVWNIRWTGRLMINLMHFLKHCNGKKKNKHFFLKIPPCATPDVPGKWMAREKAARAFGGTRRMEERAESQLTIEIGHGRNIDSHKFLISAEEKGNTPAGILPGESTAEGEAPFPETLNFYPFFTGSVEEH